MLNLQICTVIIMTKKKKKKDKKKNMQFMRLEPGIHDGFKVHQDIHYAMGGAMQITDKNNQYMLKL